MVDAKEGDVLTFRYKVSSEKKMDLLRFYLDGERLESWSGEVDWATFILALEAGPHELRWEYDKVTPARRWKTQAVSMTFV